MRARAFVVVAVGVLLVAGCKDKTKTDASATTTAPASTSTSAPTTSSSSAEATSTGPTSTASAVSSTGCKATGAGVPANATHKDMIDVDHDGAADVGWVGPPSAQDGAVPVGITTHSGATFSTTYSSASPIARTLFVADATGTGTIVAIVDSGRSAALYVIAGCKISTVKNPQGQPYTFDLGPANTGTGIGCSQVAGESGRTLVGLNLVRDPSGTVVSVKRTAVIISGTTAHNGHSDTVAATPDSAAAKSAQTISCGDRTSTADGVHGAE